VETNVLRVGGTFGKTNYTMRPLTLLVVKFGQLRFPTMSIVAIIIAFSLVGCGKGNNLKSPPPPPSSVLALSAVSPTQGGYNTQVTITGTGFSPTTSQDSVFFNGKAATILSASDSQLVVTVPAQAGTGNVTVKINGKSVQGPLFNYVWQVKMYNYAGNGSDGVPEVDGPAASASFHHPVGVALDTLGNVFVYDGNAHIRMITPGAAVGGTVSTYYKPLYDNIEFTAPIGGSLCWQNGVLYFGGNYFPTSGTYDINQQWIKVGDDLGANNTVSVFPGWGGGGLAIDRYGNLYVCPSDPYLCTITVVFKSGPLSWEIIGSPVAGDVNGTWLLNTQNQPVEAEEPSFENPEGIAVDSKGNIFTSDTKNNNIREISTQGVVSTLAGSGQAGNVDGQGLNASFSNPQYMTIDSSDNLYVLDINPFVLRKVTPTGAVTTIMQITTENVLATGIAVDPSGSSIFLPDWNGYIWKVAFQ
jgi:IPT/TIG domain/NHL repeat